MNEPAITRGLSPQDLAFVVDHCRDLALSTGEQLGHLPFAAACLSPSCVVARVADGERVRGLAIAFDRGIEREVFVVTVQFAARGQGLGQKLLQALVRPHVAASSNNRVTASVWHGVKGGAGLILRAGLDPSRGVVRFVRKTDPLTTELPAPNLRWLWIEGESADRIPRLLAPAAAANPADTNVLPALEALTSHRDGAVLVGFAGNDAKVVAAGHAAGRRWNITHLFSGPSVRDHGHAEHALARLTQRAADAGAKELILESTGPAPRALRTIMRLGFEATEAAAGFRLGPPGPRVAGDLFTL